MDLGGVGLNRQGAPIQPTRKESSCAGASLFRRSGREVHLLTRRAWKRGSERRASEGFSVLLGRSMPFQELWGPPWGRPRPDNPYIPTVSLCELPCGLMCFLLDVVPLHRKTVLPCHLPPCHYTGNFTMLQNQHVIVGRFRGSRRLGSHESPRLSRDAQRGWQSQSHSRWNHGYQVVWRPKQRNRRSSVSSHVGVSTA